MLKFGKDSITKLKNLSGEKIRNMRWTTQTFIPLPISIAIYFISKSSQDNDPLTFLYVLLGYVLPFIALHFIIVQLRDDRIEELEKQLEEKTDLISTRLIREAKRISSNTQTYTGNIKKDGKDSIAMLIDHLATISYSKCDDCHKCTHVQDCQNLLYRYLKTDCETLSKSIKFVNEGKYVLITNNKENHDVAVEHWLAHTANGGGEYLVLHFLDPDAKEQKASDYDKADELFFRSVVQHLIDPKTDISKVKIKWLFIGNIEVDFQYCYDYIPRIFRELNTYVYESDEKRDKTKYRRLENRVKAIFEFKVIPKAAFDNIKPTKAKERQIYRTFIKEDYPNIGIFGSNCVFVDEHFDHGIEHGCVFCNNDVKVLAKLFNSLCWNAVAANKVEWDDIKKKFLVFISR